MLTTSGCSYDDTAKTIIDVISKALAGEKPEKIYTVDYDLSVENSCGCEPSVEQINTGEHIRILRDRMNRYQDEERVLYELAVNIMNCETPKTLATLLKEYAFGDMAVVVNGDFFDERKDPRVSNREPLFSDKMILLRSRAVEDRDIPQPFDRTNIIPDIENIMDYKVPLIFSALAHIGVPLGYACFYFPAQLNEYFKIPLYVNSLNTALGSFRSVTYQKYMTKHIEEMYRHDMLTGLYNRTGFYNALETLPRRNDQLALVVSVDVDGLKYINDNFGHEAGDYAIRAAANAIDSVSIENKVCGRFGGDELALFAIVDTDLAEQVKKEIKDKMAELNRRSGKSYVLSVSVGAAVAPVIGQVATAALAVWYLLHMKIIKPASGDYALRGSICGRMLTLGITSFLSQISLVAAMAAINNMLRKYGALDAVFGQEQYAQIPMAVVGIVMKFFQIVISIVVGMAAGCIPIVGYNMGAEKKLRVQELFTKLLVAEALVGAVALVLAECFPRQLIAIFGAANESSYYTDFAIKAFRTYLCMMVLACVNKACFIFLQAVGKALSSTLLSMFREVVFGVGFALLLPVFFGLDGVLYSMPVSDILTFIISAVIIVKTYRELHTEGVQNA